MAHSIFAPSSTEILFHCSGSTLLQMNEPNESTIDSEEGDASHWCGENILKSFNSMMEFKSQDLIGKTAPNGVYITKEIYDCAREYANAVIKVANQFDKLRDLHIEEKIDIHRINSLMFGTPDCWFYVEETKTLHLFDYKFGHYPVSAPDNKQMICYATGIIDKLGLDDKDLFLEFNIIQPRSYDPNRNGYWKGRASDIRGAVNILKHQTNEAFTDQAKTVTGLHCRNCRARHKCSALGLHSSFIMDYVSDTTEKPLSNDEIHIELDYLERAKHIIDRRLDSLQTQVDVKLKNGETVKGYTQDDKYGDLKWIVEPSTVIALKPEFEKPQAVITPTQAIKLSKDNETFVKSISKRQYQGKKTVKVEDSKIIKAFKQTR